MTILINCLGRPDPVLLDLNEAAQAGITCRLQWVALERIRRTPLHPALTHPHELEAEYRARDAARLTGVTGQEAA